MCPAEIRTSDKICARIHIGTNRSSEQQLYKYSNIYILVYHSYFHIFLRFSQFNVLYREIA